MARCMTSGYSRCPNQATYRIKGWGGGLQFLRFPHHPRGENTTGRLGPRGGNPTKGKA